MGADAVVIRHGASGAPHRLADSGWIDGGGRQRRRRHPRAPHPGAARRVHDAPAPRRRRGRPRRPAGRDRRRRPAQPGRPLQRRCCCTPSAPRSPWSRRRRCCRSGSRRGRARSRYDLDARAARRADVVMMLRVQRERMNARVLPDRRASTRRRYGLDARRAGAAARARDRHAPRADEPRAWRSPPTSPTRPARVIVEQVANGVSVRMAVLYLLLGGSESAIGRRPTPTEEVAA